MQVHPFGIALLLALCLSVGLRLWLARRQYRHVGRHQDRVPDAFAGRISAAAHRRAADYTRAKIRFGLLDIAVSTALLLGLTLFGGLQLLVDAWHALLPSSPLLQQAMIVVSVILIGSLIELPFDWYRQFVLEARFGFNRMTPGLFLADLAKGTLLGALIGLPLLLAVLWLMRETGALWWLGVWIVWTLFNLVVLLVFPTWIAPLFNKFKPLESGEVRSRVEALMARCGFAASGLFVMDGSKRSAHGNAYFTGFGKSKRIVFFDTLLARLDVAEIEAVLAHELGHFSKRHIVKRIAVSFVVSLLGLAVLGALANQPWFYEGLGVQATASAAASPGILLVLFFLALPVFTFPLRPVTTWLSRRDEFEADAFAASHSSARQLANALVKLYEDNAATLTPDPLHSAFYDSHPPATIRLGRLAGLAGTDGR